MNQQMDLNNPATKKDLQSEISSLESHIDIKFDQLLLKIQERVQRIEERLHVPHD